jgi:hypothetical protein
MKTIKEQSYITMFLYGTTLDSTTNYTSGVGLEVNEHLQLHHNNLPMYKSLHW